MAVLSDAKHTVLFKGFTAPSQLTFPIPHPSLCNSLAVSSPQHFAVLSLLARQSSEKQPLPNCLCICTAVQCAVPARVPRVGVMM